MRARSVGMAMAHEDEGRNMESQEGGTSRRAVLGRTARRMAGVAAVGLPSAAGLGWPSASWGADKVDKAKAPGGEKCLSSCVSECTKLARGEANNAHMY